MKRSPRGRQAPSQWNSNDDPSTPLPSADSPAWPVAILGAPFDNVTRGEAIARIEAMIASRHPHCVLIADSDLLWRARHDVELHRILLEADLLLGDGAALRWAARLLGNPLAQGVGGLQLLPDLLSAAAKQGQRIFFLGAERHAAVHLLRAQTSTPNFTGHFPTVDHSLWEMDHDAISRQIRAARPDLLLVALASPTQEKWIAMHYRSLGVPVTIGIGAAAHRPGRARIRNFFQFFSAVARQAWQLRPRSVEPGPLEEPASFAASNRLRVWAGSRLDSAALTRDAAFWREAIEVRNHCLLDLSQVRSIDSAGAALLVHWRKELALRGRKLVLIIPSQEAQQALRALRLQDYFLTTDELEDHSRFLTPGVQTRLPVQRARQDSPSLLWRDEITAVNVDEVWQLTLQHLETLASRQSTVVIALSELRFIDSSGVGVMLRLQKWANETGLRLSFTDAQPNVQNVLRLAQLDRTLLTPA